MSQIQMLLQKTICSLKEQGLKSTAQKIRNYSTSRKNTSTLQSQHYEPFMDVLFINGCDPVVAPHPPRYRVSHQKEQLIANNIVSNEVYYTQLSLDQVRNYRVFIFFRCPYTPVIGAFIRLAKELHKAVLFDIDDLVIDTKYTDLIPYVQALSPEEKAVYDDGVIRMGKTLALCDGAITTTECLAEELSHYVPEVFINRNTASERMLELSEQAVLSRESTSFTKDSKALKEKRRGKARRKKQPARTFGVIRLGYFSGSITHNADFALILPAIARILKKNPQVELHVVGELDISSELYPYQEQIVKREFVSWEQLPALIASVDINIAPLETNLFNKAKSENKWVEAALVKVPTVASDVGAFRHMIRHGETGLLCRTVDEWYQALDLLISDEEKRLKMAENAYQYCRKHCVTTYTGFPLTKFIKQKMTPNAAFILPSLEISGGIMVALRHAGFLFDIGRDVFLISEVPGTGWMEFEKYRFPVISKNHHPMFGHIDKAVATMWTTTQFLELYPKIQDRYYLVQGFETDFYAPNIFLRVQANQSYSLSCQTRFVTISKWCQRWLWENFEKRAKYAPNGIESAKFRPHRRNLTGKVRILIEGDCAVHYKNVDESFLIADMLDPKWFEIWYMSYNASPKPEYRVDRFLHRVPYEKVFEVYAQCDILLKSSILESFSYPPLEMMASGGYAVVVPNVGNTEYLVDEENCLMYEQGDVKQAAEQIHKLCQDTRLQERLYQGGIYTAQARDWSIVKPEIFALYGVMTGETCDA